MLKFNLIIFYVSCLVAIKAAIVPIEDQDTNITEERTKEQRNSTLKLVHLLFRHGPRTPLSTYPKDPHINETYEPYGWGQLTNPAKVELYKLGKQLRQRYKDFLQPYYQPDMIHAQATESPRTLMSLQMVLAGLFPPENTPMEWNLLLDWQPIPIFAESEETDLRLRQKVPCPRYDEAVREVMSLPEIKELHAQNSKMLQELTELTGFNVTYAHDVTNVFITLQSEEAYGLKLPQWTKNYYPDKMLPLAAQTYQFDAYTPEMRKLKGGFFLDHLYKQLQSKISGKLQPNGRKMFIYCGHDWTIANVLSALDVWKPQMPRFSALIAIELHKMDDTGEYFVEIHFQNGAQEELELLQVPGCDKQCPMEKLLDLSKNILPDGDYEQLCKAKGTNSGERISYH